MIRVGATIYRTLWIAVVILGALMTLSVLLLIPQEGVKVISGAPAIVLASLLGVCVTMFAIRRLRRPLTAAKRD